MANHIINWVGNNILPWVLIGITAIAGLVVLGMIAAFIWSFFDKSTPQIVLDSSEWQCTQWHEEKESVPPLLIGGMIYPQPKRAVTVADVYVRKSFLRDNLRASEGMKS